MNTGDRFLDAVAADCMAYANSNPGSILIFPNKRAAIYFRGYMRRHLKGTVLMPRIMTIGAFYSLFAEDDDFETDPIELLFILYSAYCNVARYMGAEPVDFGKFTFWGWMMLSDFNDIDASLADADALYTNLKRYNEISAYFLNEEQIRIIAEIWGERVLMNFTPPHGSNDFWKHLSDTDDGNGDGVRERFLKLWQIMGPIYKEFNEMLEQRGIVYQGRIVRTVAERIKAAGRNGLPFDNVAFIGFNNISIGLAKIMSTLRDWGMARFYWDTLPDRPYCRRAGRPLHRLAEAFPMPDSYSPPQYTNPKITFKAIPSNFMQTKETANVIKSLGQDGHLDTLRSDNTAVMLPDPTLLTGLLQSIPDVVSAINVTMGLPYRNTDFASVIRSIISLNMRGGVFHGRLCFFHEDITQLVTQPVMRTLAPEACVAIRDTLVSTRQFRIPAEVLRQTPGLKGLQCIFAELTDPDSPSEAKMYFLTILDALRECIESNTDRDNTKEIAVLDAYSHAADTVFSMIEKYGVDKIRRGTVFGLLERILALQKFSLSGSPVRGLQIMEPLETRCVDFDNVIMLSMNESVYPRRRQMRSMIPQALRRAYGLPVSDDTDNEFAYYFFRLLSRSQNVVCMYDSRVSGRGNGAMSRHLLQLKYLGGGNMVTERTMELVPAVSGQRTITIPKTDEVYNRLMRYMDPMHGRNISASALKNYRKCPLKFYLENVEALHEDEEPEPFMNAVTYGNVVHKVLEDLFNEAKSKTIDVAALKRMHGQTDELELRILRVINELYYFSKNSVSADKPLPGEARLLAKMIKDTIDKVIEKEKATVTAPNSGPFTFVAAEESYGAIARDNDIRCPQWKVTPDTTINFKLIIDRHDVMFDGVHRFVDYKTGSDHSVVDSLDALFGQGANANDAIFQLCVYAMAYADITGFKGTVRPALYRFQDAFKPRPKERPFSDDSVYIGKDPVIFSNADNAGTPAWQNEFRQRLNDMIDSIFDRNIPFVQTSDTHNCKYCSFAEVCGRMVSEDSF